MTEPINWRLDKASVAYYTDNFLDTVNIGEVNQPIMWTTVRQHEYRNTPEQEAMQLRMHNDLRALQGLSDKLPIHLGARLVVEKGYAVDASCAGYLTRLHYDTDVLVATPDSVDTSELYSFIEDTLGLYTGFPWVPTPQSRDSWVKFHERGKRQWDDGITGTSHDFALAHQMDVHIVRSRNPLASDEYLELATQQGQTYRKPIVRANLEDACGHSFEFTVPQHNDIAATKLRLISSFRTQYNHELRDSDIYDFGLLFRGSKFDSKLFVSHLTDYYLNQGIPEQSIPAHIMTELEPISGIAPQQLIDELSASITT